MRQLANSFTHNWVVLLGACVLLLDVVRGLLTGALQWPIAEFKGAMTPRCIGL